MILYTLCSYYVEVFVSQIQKSLLKGPMEINDKDLDPQRDMRR